MPPKKPLSTVEETLPVPEGETHHQKLIRTILTLQKIMTTILDSPGNVSAGQLIDACEMFIVQMHLKRVTEEWFVEHLSPAMKTIEVCLRVRAEASLLDTEGLSEQAKQTLHGAMQLGGEEIRHLMPKLLADVKLLGEIPLPEIKHH